ncbi:hypothetical protein TNCV_2543091 [Trichonephila clavipes]|nr:hypothetical protein TNCV_2543091 [Trichonephila clavipes]
MNEVVANATCMTVSDRSLRNSSRQRARCTPVISRSFEHYTGDSAILTRYHPNFEGEHSGSVQGPSTSLFLPSTSRGNLLFDGYSIPIPRRHDTFTNIHVFSGIRTQVQRHSCQMNEAVA